MLFVFLFVLLCFLAEPYRAGSADPLVGDPADSCFSSPLLSLQLLVVVVVIVVVVLDGVVVDGVVRAFAIIEFCYCVDCIAAASALASASARARTRVERSETCSSPLSGLSSLRAVSSPHK